MATKAAPASRPMHVGRWPTTVALNQLLPLLLPPQAAIDEGEDGDGEGGASAPASYDYLLSMPLSSLTLEKVQALQSESEDWQATVQRLRATTEKDMWRSDLDAFEMVRLVCPRGRWAAGGRRLGLAGAWELWWWWWELPRGMAVAGMLPVGRACQGVPRCAEVHAELCPALLFPFCRRWMGLMRRRSARGRSWCGSRRGPRQGRRHKQRRRRPRARASATSGATTRATPTSPAQRVGWHAWMDRRMEAVGGAVVCCRSGLVAAYVLVG